MGESVRMGVVVAVAILLRWCVTYHPYSGQGKPPMYGDYEAQRHWQELTLNLPIDQWYTNTTDNDLEYWGLDYPPLTAYHSLLLGRIARMLNPKFVELYKSRGFESDDHKYFMRLSVIFADIFFYVAAIVYFVCKITILETAAGQIERNNIFGLTKRDFILLSALLYPGIILIDHGHFQYNCVSLGLFVAAVTLILQNSMIIGSFLFVLSLNYKQMELYHALPFFIYILGNNIPGKRKSLLSCLRTLICVSLTVILNFIIIWAPFTQKWSMFSDAVSRLFPFARGVFEDKVANIWCAVNVIYKLRQSFTNHQLARICFMTTTIAILPSSVDLYIRPVKEKFVVSLINSALAFYLFSFQVHEKSILLAAIPVVLYLHKDPLPCFWFLLISTFSMLPLLIKDGLYQAYFALSLFYGLSVYLMWPQEFVTPIVKEKEIRSKSKAKKDTSVMRRKSKAKQSSKSRSNDSKGFPYNIINKLQNFLETHVMPLKTSSLLFFAKFTLFYISVTGVIALSLVSIFVEPPSRYPDLFPLLVSLYSCGHFCAFFLYFNYKQIYVLHSTKAKPY